MVTKDEILELKVDGSLSGSKGSILNVGQSRMRARYYRQDSSGRWIQTDPLPADPASITAYFSKGFKAKPPQDATIEIEPIGDGLVSCPIPDCNFRAQNALGLRSHLRKHIPNQIKSKKGGK